MIHTAIYTLISCFLPFNEQVPSPLGPCYSYHVPLIPLHRQKSGLVNHSSRIIIFNKDWMSPMAILNNDEFLS